MTPNQSILVQAAVILWQVKNNGGNTTKKNQDKTKGNKYYQMSSMSTDIPAFMVTARKQFTVQGKINLHPSGNKYRNRNEDG
jgi:hypothetical protein